eukprot:8476597-Pyramimonas_sp.AAC.1
MRVPAAMQRVAHESLSCLALFAQRFAVCAGRLPMSPLLLHAAVSKRCAAAAGDRVAGGLWQQHAQADQA